MRYQDLGFTAAVALATWLTTVCVGTPRQEVKRASVHVDWWRLAESEEANVADAKIGIWQLRMSLPNSTLVLDSRWIGDRDGRFVPGPKGDVAPEFHAYEAESTVQWDPRLSLTQDLVALVPVDYGSEEFDFMESDAKLTRGIAEVRDDLTRREAALSKRFKAVVNPAALVLKRVDSK